MGAERKSLAKHRHLDEMVDFGPDDAVPVTPRGQDVTARLERLLKQIQEISRRVDELSSRE